MACFCPCLCMSGFYWNLAGVSSDLNCNKTAALIIVNIVVIVVSTSCDAWLVWCQICGCIVLVAMWMLSRHRRHLMALVPNSNSCPVVSCFLISHLTPCYVTLGCLTWVLAHVKQNTVCLYVHLSVSVCLSACLVCLGTLLRSKYITSAVFYCCHSFLSFCSSFECNLFSVCSTSFLPLLVFKYKWCGAVTVIYLEQGANDLHMVQLMPLPPHHPCFIKIKIGFNLSGASLPCVTWKRGH